MQAWMDQVKNRLGIGYKMVVVALTFSIPIAILATLVLIKINQEIQFSIVEKMGNAYHLPIEQLLNDLQEYQIGLLYPTSDFEKERWEEKIKEDFDQLTFVDEELGNKLQP